MADIGMGTYPSCRGSLESETVNMVIGLGTKNDCADEGLQQL
jgi:hypothetical protein